MVGTILTHVNHVIIDVRNVLVHYYNNVIIVEMIQQLLRMFPTFYHLDLQIVHLNVHMVNMKIIQIIIATCAASIVLLVI